MRSGARSRARAGACIRWAGSRSRSTSRFTPLTALVEAPLLVSGELRVPGGLEGASVEGAELAGNRVTFSFRLGDGLPLTRTIRLTGRVTDAAARRTPPRRDAGRAPPHARRAREARRAEAADGRGEGLPPQRAGAPVPDVPAQPRARAAPVSDTGRYVYVDGAPRGRAAPRSESGSGGGIGALGLALSVVGGIAAVGGAAVAWAHL